MHMPAQGPDPVEEEHSPEYWAEIEGRTRRTTRFRVREAHEGDVLPDDPRRYVLEQAFGATGRSAPLTEADLKALERVIAKSLNGDEMPAEG